MVSGFWHDRLKVVFAQTLIKQLKKEKELFFAVSIHTIVYCLMHQSQWNDQQNKRNNNINTCFCSGKKKKKNFISPAVAEKLTAQLHSQLHTCSETASFTSMNNDLLTEGRTIYSRNYTFLNPYTALVCNVDFDSTRYPSGGVAALTPSAVYLKKKKSYKSNSYKNMNHCPRHHQL